MIGLCFNPRHGRRAVSHNKRVDFLICFECYQVAIYVDGKFLAAIRTTASPQPTFDKSIAE
jgi:hypothetical protein